MHVLVLVRACARGDGPMSECAAHRRLSHVAVVVAQHCSDGSRVLCQSGWLE